MQTCIEDSPARRAKYHKKLSRFFRVLLLLEFPEIIADSNILVWGNRSYVRISKLILKFTYSYIMALTLSVSGQWIQLAWEIVTQQAEVMMNHLHLLGIVRSLLEICDECLKEVFWEE